MIAYHQLIFRFPDPHTNPEYTDALDLCQKSLNDHTDIRRETIELHKFFTEKVGELVDLNLDFFPYFIIGTFLSHSDVE